MGMLSCVRPVAAGAPVTHARFIASHRPTDRVGGLIPPLSEKVPRGRRDMARFYILHGRGREFLSLHEDIWLLCHVWESAFCLANVRSGPDSSLIPRSCGDARPELYQSLFKRKLKNLLVSIGIAYKIV